MCSLKGFITNASLPCVFCIECLLYGVLHGCSILLDPYTWYALYILLVGGMCVCVSYTLDVWYILYLACFCFAVLGCFVVSGAVYPATGRWYAMLRVLCVLIAVLWVLENGYTVCFIVWKVVDSVQGLWCILLYTSVFSVINVWYAVHLIYSIFASFVLLSALSKTLR